MANIPNTTEYITVKRDNFGEVKLFVGGKPAKRYRGMRIYDIDYVEYPFALIQEQNPNIMELHVLSSKTSGKFAEVNNPSSEPGRYAWMRVVLSDGTVGDWVYALAYGSATMCAHRCAFNCALYVRAYAAFRRAVLDAAVDKQNVETNSAVKPENPEIEKLKAVDFSKLPKGPIKLKGYRILVEKVCPNTK